MSVTRLALRLSPSGCLAQMFGVLHYQEMYTTTEKNLSLIPPRRVEVWDGSGEKYRGKGTLVDYVDVEAWIMPDGTIISITDGADPLTKEQESAIIEHGGVAETIEYNPKIILDDGEVVVYGCQTYWKFLHETE